MKLCKKHPDTRERFRCRWCHKNKIKDDYKTNSSGTRDRICKYCQAAQERKRRAGHVKEMARPVEWAVIQKQYELTPEEVVAVELAAQMMLTYTRKSKPAILPDVIISGVTSSVKRQCQLLGAVTYRAKELRAA